ncbi:phosphatidylcholine/phosphatidylserine synthase [Tsukamurella paurometabola]|uniref:CDP-diacylglycerol-serine O-phosphatidyltransferase n=2 Tax=Tsukamurella paurometabola TaxID=2061 RepID=A0A3P8MB76_TSUPA|nr:phosphatidylcholine/phosphatidylserine synthase [Tsukamurella paurometabola]MBS4100636.1 phosphatidylcholine/phosphatidylserine synthase [Tsukamurella paurometabola]UEA82030.1 phosphatidylcholine/phosphatidylserine synthase [Tsukamurella paurometabola]VDR39060.1 CDP-diacylglycerol-serine O-phosphatidyltransferase [Tsukamurella paurometabola]
MTESPSAPHRPVGVMILPSMLTVAALCAGLTGVRFAADGKVDLAIMLVVIAAILDGLDGRVARLLGASTRIGAELDSLADAINFGVTPALILYFVCFPGSPAGWIVALLYVVAMVLRLARFNTLAADPTAPAYTKDFFVGVPAPAGAMLVLAPLAAQQEWGDGWWVSTPMVAAWTLFVAALTVSRIPTSSFKTMTVQPAKAAGVLVAVAGLAALILTYPYIALLLVIALYLLHIPFAWRSKRWVVARPEAWDRKPAERRAMRREQRRPVRPHRRAATAGRGGRRTAARLGLRRPTRED